MTLSRRDRAACVLAYECLRRDGCADSLDVLEHGDTVHALSAAIDVPRCNAAPLHSPEVAAWLHEWRLLRARLALFLRATLRVNRLDYWGDPEPYRAPRRDVAEMLGHCARCGWTYGDADPAKEDCAGMGRTGRIWPLWERAPATGHGVRPASLKRR